MIVVARALTAIHLASAAVLCKGEEPDWPRIVFPVTQSASDSYLYSVTNLIGREIAVESDLIQIELTKGVILSANRKAIFSITTSKEYRLSFGISVTTGPVIVVDVDANRAWCLASGIHNVERRAGNEENQISAWHVTAETPMPWRNDRRSDIKDPVLLSDGIMVRQRRFLDTLRIDAKELNRGIISVIRKLLPPAAKP